MLKKQVRCVLVLSLFIFVDLHFNGFHILENVGCMVSVCVWLVEMWFKFLVIYFPKYNHSFRKMY